MTLLTTLISEQNWLSSDAQNILFKVFFGHLLHFFAAFPHLVPDVRAEHRVLPLRDLRGEAAEDVLDGLAAPVHAGEDALETGGRDGRESANRKAKPN